MRVLVALLMGAGVAVAQSRVEGRVVGAAGEALAKASVTLDRLPAVSTDNDGKFVFEDVPAGRYTRLTAQKAGFVTQIYGARTNLAFGTVLNLTSGADLKDLVIQMKAQGVISGHISDHDGDPAAGALIAVNFYTYAQGRRQLSPDFNGVVADDRGDFRIANVAPGRYYLKAQPRRVATTSQSREPALEAEVTTFYPNGLDEAGAKALDLKGGGELRGIDIKLRRERVYSIRGKIVDQSNSPRGNLSLTLSKLDGKPGLPFFFRARPDGTFEFLNQSPGSYLIQTLPGSATDPIVHTQVTITDGSLDGLVLAAVPGLDINGTVKLEGGDLKALVTPGTATGPVAVTDVFTTLPLSMGSPSRLSISLASTMAGSSSNSAAIKEDGTFRIPGLGAGTYLVSIGGVPEGVYVKSVKFGERDLMRAPLDLASGGGGSIAVVLSSKGAEVAGRARVSGAIVTLWPKIPAPGNASGGVKQDYADQNGSFRVTGLGPGEYYVAAWDELEPGLWQGAEFLWHFNGDAASIKVEEGAHVTLDPKLVPRERYTAEVEKLP